MYCHGTFFKTWQSSKELFDVANTKEAESDGNQKHIGRYEGTKQTSCVASYANITENLKCNSTLTDRAGQIYFASDDEKGLTNDTPQRPDVPHLGYGHLFESMRERNKKMMTQSSGVSNL
jgi:hypothetical protein